MRIVSVNSLQGGQRIGKPVYAADGRILLTKGSTLTEGYIRHLKQKKIPAVYIDDAISEEIVVKDALDHDLRIQIVGQAKEILEEISPYGKRRGRGLVSTEQYVHVRKIVKNILDNIEKDQDALYNMIEILSTDLATYNHLVNVAVLSIMTAYDSGLAEEKIMDLATGALLHDVGKSKVPPEILNKSGKLTGEEWEMIKEHPMLGYNMVNQNPNISAIAKTIILMHHEKLDGSGYPMGLKGDEINQYVKIVTVCDMFDAMISARAYKARMPIYQVLEYLNSLTVSEIDANVYLQLLKNAAIYPEGSGVLLNTGEKCLVMQNNKLNPTRPKVRIINNVDGSLNMGIDTIDLMKELTLFVVDSCEIVI